jgi:hypothetical protein
LEPGSNVDAITEQVASMHHHIAHVQTDAKQNGCWGLGGCDLLLHLDCALDSVHGAWELSQDAVACRIGDPASMVGNQAVHHLTMDRQSPQSPDLRSCGSTLSSFDNPGLILSLVDGGV